MAHKVHPKAFRMSRTQDWESRGFYQKKLPLYLEEDFLIREILSKKLKEGGVQNIEIERSANKAEIIINSSRPGLIIGRGGAGIEEMKNLLKKNIPTLRKREFKIEIREIRSPWSSASLVAQWVADRIERRMPPRRVLKQTLDKVLTEKSILGARVEVAGRLGGSDIARREWLKRGSLPRQTIRANIEYAQAEAFCSYGVIGVKVWMYKGEREE